MCIFDPAIFPPPYYSAISDAKLFERGWIGFETIGHDLDRASMTFQGFLEETQSCLFVQLFRDIAFQDLAFVIDGTPQVMGLTIDVRYAALRVTKTSSACQRHCV